MTAGYAGAFSGIDGGAFAGWSNFSTAAGTQFARYDDGDPVSAVIWRELYGNVNYLLAKSARPIWQDSFVDDGSADPTYANSDTAWDWASVYAVLPGVPLIPNLRHGPHAPSRLSVKVRFRCTAGGGASTGTVRVYGIGSTLRGLQGGFDGTGPYVEFSQAATTYSDASSTGFTAAQTLTPNVYESELTHLAYDANDHPILVPVLMTSLVLCGTGAGAPKIAAISVVEEAPAA